MSAWTAEDVDRHNAKIGAKLPAHVKPSKYRNVRTVVGSETFDSKREADYWQELKIRERAGEIVKLERQVRIPLYGARYDLATDSHIAVHVADYIADYVYEDAGTHRRHVVDAKGKRTQMYALKAKWLRLAANVEIEEV